MSSATENVKSATENVISTTESVNSATQNVNGEGDEVSENVEKHDDSKGTKKTIQSNARETVKTTKSNMPDNQTRQPPTKKKKLSNFEKGISLICSTLNETSKREMDRYDL